MFPYNLLPETPDISAINNKKASLIPNPPLFVRSYPAILNLPLKYISRSSHISITVPLHALDLPVISSTQSIEISTGLSIFMLIILCRRHTDLTLEGCMIHLNGWMGPNLWFNHTTGKFVTRERFRYRAEKCYGRRGR
jgi:hypothetical protein